MDNKNEKETVNLLKKAELSMELRDYERVDLHKKKAAIGLVLFDFASSLSNRNHRRVNTSA